MEPSGLSTKILKELYKIKIERSHVFQKQRHTCPQVVLQVTTIPFSKAELQYQYQTQATDKCGAVSGRGPPCLKRTCGRSRSVLVNPGVPCDITILGPPLISLSCAVPLLFLLEMYPWILAGRQWIGTFLFASTGCEGMFTHCGSAE